MKPQLFRRGARLLANGDRDSNFDIAHSANPGPSMSVVDVAIDSQDGIVILGSRFDPFAQSDFAINKYDSSGSLDSSFGDYDQ